VPQIHTSQISSYQVCPRMYYFAYVKKLVPIVESPKLMFGRGVHKGLEIYYQTRKREDALVAYRKWLAEQDAPVEETTSENAALGEQLLNSYIDYATKQDTFKTVAVEQQFVVPIWRPDGSPSEYEHVGTVDGVVRNTIYGDLWLLEHKTARNFPTEFELQLNAQVSHYLLAAQQLFDEQVRGVVYNVIRKVNPNRAKTPVIMRRLITRTPAELRNTMDQMYRVAERISHDEYFDPAPGFHCSWRCTYQQLCMCMQDGTDYTQLAAQMYRVREDKDLVVGDDDAA
jgi:putative RecB family exonuclease